ncbi:hypothetical protein AKJ16_DCAP16588 [Drosera capensis]
MVVGLRSVGVNVNLKGKLQSDTFGRLFDGIEKMSRRKELCDLMFELAIKEDETMTCDSAKPHDIVDVHPSKEERRLHTTLLTSTQARRSSTVFKQYDRGKETLKSEEKDDIEENLENEAKG